MLIGEIKMMVALASRMAMFFVDLTHNSRRNICVTSIVGESTPSTIVVIAASTPRTTSAPIVGWWRLSLGNICFNKRCRSR